jgi:hypothetical protein
MNRLIILVRNGFGALLLCMLGVSFSAQAQAGGFTALEIASLPQYCQDKLNQNANKERWASQFGRNNWLHAHHFCYGLIQFSRASMEVNPGLRSRNAGYAISEFNYVLQRWPANFPLYQQAQMYKAQLEMMRKY